MEVVNLFVEVSCELPFWHEACCGEGCADLLDFRSGSELGGQFGRYGDVFEVAKAESSDV